MFWSPRRQQTALPTPNLPALDAGSLGEFGRKSRSWEAFVALKMEPRPSDKVAIRDGFLPLSSRSEWRYGGPRYDEPRKKLAR
jgi:hypothetical protein